MNKSITICIYFSEESTKGYPFNVPEYVQSYLDFFKSGTQRYPHITFFVVRGDSYKGNGLFTHGEQYDANTNTLVPYKKKIQASIVYNKGKFQGDFPILSQEQAPLVNAHMLDYLGNNKMLSALLFPDLHMQTIEVHTQAQLRIAIGLIKTRMVVLKPRDGFGGSGVLVLPKKEALKKKVQLSVPYIVQEFIDTRKGLPGFTNGVHDMRVTCMNGNIVQAFIRIPKKRSLLTNLAQGGHFIEVPKKEIPKEVLSMVRTIDKSFKHFKTRIFSVDVGYDAKQGYKLFEINPLPGFPYPSMKHYYHTWHEALLDTLLTVLK